MLTHPSNYEEPAAGLKVLWKECHPLFLETLKTTSTEGKVRGLIKLQQ